ncbi:60S ribosomal protein L8B [Mortierella sp. GBA30]|nr:60S ribosomal protein L8B [Mortierella sp. GBA30]
MSIPLNQTLKGRSKKAASKKKVLLHPKKQATNPTPPKVFPLTESNISQHLRLQHENPTHYPNTNLEARQFRHALDKKLSKNLFKLAHKYRPETRREKLDRLRNPASTSTGNTTNGTQAEPDDNSNGGDDVADGDLVSSDNEPHVETDAEINARSDDDPEDVDWETTAGDSTKIKAVTTVTTAMASPPYILKFGINHVKALVEAKKATLVLIANDVDPVDLVLSLPALCRKKGVPYAIVRDKARLGSLIHKKHAATVCFTAIRNEHKDELKNLIAAFLALLIHTLFA